ncbi:MAG: hypothetical protein V1664_04885 [Candidatus Uhrbacteria bacterium]
MFNVTEIERVQLAILVAIDSLNIRGAPDDVKARADQLLLANLKWLCDRIIEDRAVNPGSWKLYSRHAGLGMFLGLTNETKSDRLKIAFSGCYWHNREDFVAMLDKAPNDIADFFLRAIDTREDMSAEYPKRRRTTYSHRKTK